MDFHLNETAIKKKLYSGLELEIQDDILFEEFNSIKRNMIDFFEKLSLYSSYNFEFTSDIEMTKILDSVAIKVKETDGFFVENMVDYIKTIHGLQGKDIFIIANCRGFIRDEDCRHIRDLVDYEKIILLFLDCNQLKMFGEVNELVIDKDLCEI